MYFQVLMKDITTLVPSEDTKRRVQNCLEKAAKINYSQLMDYAQINGGNIRTGGFLTMGCYLFSPSASIYLA